jgi:hypothetical protein
MIFGMTQAAVVLLLPMSVSVNLRLRRHHPVLPAVRAKMCIVFAAMTANVPKSAPVRLYVLPESVHAILVHVPLVIANVLQLILLLLKLPVPVFQ